MGIRLFPAVGAPYGSGPHSAGGGSSYCRLDDNADARSCHCTPASAPAGGAPHAPVCHTPRPCHRPAGRVGAGPRRLSAGRVHSQRWPPLQLLICPRNRSKGNQGPPAPRRGRARPSPGVPKAERQHLAAPRSGSRGDRPMITISGSLPPLVLAFPAAKTAMQQACKMPKRSRSSLNSSDSRNPWCSPAPRLARRSGQHDVGSGP